MDSKEDESELDIPIFHPKHGCPDLVDTNWGPRAEEKKKGRSGTEGFFRATFWLLYSFLWNACWTKTSPGSQTFQLRVFSPTYFSYYSYSPAWVKLKQAWNNFINIKPHDNGKQSLLMVYFLIILWYISSSPPSPSATTFWFHSAAWAWQGLSTQHWILEIQEFLSSREQFGTDHKSCSNRFLKSLYLFQINILDALFYPEYLWSHTSSKGKKNWFYSWNLVRIPRLACSGNMAREALLQYHIFFLSQDHSFKI